MDERLQKYFDTYFAPIVEAKGLRKREELSQDMGALIIYESTHLLLRLVYDRGQVSLDLASRHGKTKYHDMELCARLVAPELYEGKQGIVRLSHEDLTQTLVKHWDKFEELYSKKSYKATNEKMEQWAYERSETMFPGMMPAPKRKWIKRFW